VIRVAQQHHPSGVQPIEYISCFQAFGQREFFPGVCGLIPLKRDFFAGNSFGILIVKDAALEKESSGKGEPFHNYSLRQYELRQVQRVRD
jgi:hypothetical protein